MQQFERQGALIGKLLQGGKMPLRDIVKATPEIPWGNRPTNHLRNLVKYGGLVAEGGGFYSHKPTQVPDYIYVVIGHTVDQKDSLVVYAGKEKSKADQYAAVGDGMTYYTQLEKWLDGERVE